jgi:hypothetical protein
MRNLLLFLAIVTSFDLAHCEDQLIAGPDESHFSDDSLVIERCEERRTQNNLLIASCVDLGVRFLRLEPKSPKIQLASPPQELKH